MLGWALCSAALISRAPIIACGGPRDPLHGGGGAALIRGEATGFLAAGKWRRGRAMTSDTLVNGARRECLVRCSFRV